MLSQQLWWLVSSLFLIIFFFWYFFPKSLLLTFRSKVSLEGWPLISLPSRLLNLTFSDSAFGCLSFCHFSRVSWFHPCQLESFLSYFLSWFFFLDSSRYQPLVHELLVSKPSDSFLHHWVADRDISILIPFVSWHPFLNCLNLTLALLHVLRISSSWQSPGIQAQFSPLGFLAIFWPWRVGLFFFPLFHEF